MTKKRYTARVEEQKKTKDYAFIVLDKRTQDEIVLGGYKTSGSAWRGYKRLEKNLFKEGVIEIIK